MSGPGSLADTLRTGLTGWANRLFGCAHRKTAFPVTLPARLGADGQILTQAETYVVCLECGHHISYDWGAMRAGEKRGEAR
jgi:hypothetical protein